MTCSLPTLHFSDSALLHTHIHMHTHMLAHTRTQACSHTHTHIYTLSHTLDYLHTHTHNTPIRSNTPIYTHTLSHFVSLSLNHTHIHTLSHTHIHRRETYELLTRMPEVRMFHVPYTTHRNTLQHRGNYIHSHESPIYSYACLRYTYVMCLAQHTATQRKLHTLSRGPYIIIRMPEVRIFHVPDATHCNTVENIYTLMRALYTHTHA